MRKTLSSMLQKEQERVQLDAEDSSSKAQTTSKTQNFYRFYLWQSVTWQQIGTRENGVPG